MQSVYDFKNKLKEKVSKGGIEHFLIHADATRAPLKTISKKANLLKQEFVSDLDYITNDSNYSLACFNFDFIKTGLYSVGNSICEVGALNEFIRKKKPENRTLTPVFSHTYKYEINFSESLLPCDPFSSTSFYGWLLKKNSILLHYGSGLEHTTLIHFVERTGKQLLYRYDKCFKGVVETFEGKSLESELIYHVRPKGIHLVYDWERLEIDLNREKIMNKWRFGNKRISYFEILVLTNYWLERFNANPYYFLDKESITVVDKLVQKLGRRLLITDFEQNE